MILEEQFEQFIVYKSELQKALFNIGNISECRNGSINV